MTSFKTFARISEQIPCILRRSWFCVSCGQGTVWVSWLTASFRLLAGRIIPSYPFYPWCIHSLQRGHCQRQSFVHQDVFRLITAMYIMSAGMDSIKSLLIFYIYSYQFCLLSIFFGFSICLSSWKHSYLILTFKQK